MFLSKQRKQEVQASVAFSKRPERLHLAAEVVFGFDAACKQGR